MVELRQTVGFLFFLAEQRVQIFARFVPHFREETEVVQSSAFESELFRVHLQEFAELMNAHIQPVAKTYDFDGRQLETASTNFASGFV